jgi:hypothetical protein
MIGISSLLVSQVVATLFFSFGAVEQEWHTRPDKWAEPRIFHSPFDKRYHDRILVSRVPAEKFSETEIAPNRAYWFTVRHPNYMTPSPWSTQIFVHNERAYLLRIELRDHGNGEVKINWINEKLLHMRVWWGRILGSDLIFDVESEKMVLREMLHDGVIPFQQFQQPRSR